MNELHSTYALLHDPLSFNYLKDGPPYLPGLVGGKVASRQATDRVWLRKAAEESVSDVAVAFQHAMVDYGNAPMAELAVLLACVKAEALIHQAHHWQTSGSSYYGDHILFERVYGEVANFQDGLGERAVGKGDSILVQPLLQINHMLVFSKLFYSDAPVKPAPEEMPLLSLRALLKSALLLQLAYVSLEERGLLSNGVDNLLQGIADRQEEMMYLLKQRTQTRQASQRPEVAAFQQAIEDHRAVTAFIEALP